jgi:hypothetical protein
VQSGEITFHGAGSAPSGSYYSDVVPRTLDLAERAVLGVNYLTSTVMPDFGHEMYFGALLDQRQPSWALDVMRESGTHFFRDAYPKPFTHMSVLGACQAKAIEALAFARVMSGSRQNLGVESSEIEMLDSMFGPDGLHWVNPGNKPWMLLPEPFAMVHGQGRMLRALIAWWQYTGDDHWARRIDGLVDGLWHMASHRDDYSFFPIHGRLDREYWRSCYTRSGWLDEDEPSTEKEGEEGSLFNHQGHLPGALATWARLSGNEEALELSGRLVRFLTAEKFWGDFGSEYPDVVGPQHAHWRGHLHGHVNTLRAILEFALAARDARLLQFVRDGYEWARQAGFARIGYMGDGQGCGTGRMIGLAVKLSDAGVGDYWEDVDQYIRNHGTEMQFTQVDVERLAATIDRNDPLLAQLVGGYAGSSKKNTFFLCCGPHGIMGLYYAWDGIIRRHGRETRVNLLLNRGSAEIDVRSYLPNEGRVVITAKLAQALSVRIPLWVDTKTVVGHINGCVVEPVWQGRYAYFGSVDSGDAIELTFAVVSTTEEWTIPILFNDATAGTWPVSSSRPAEMIKARCSFRGNDLITMEPSIPGSPLYMDRAATAAGAAGTQSVDRFIWHGTRLTW